jgi:hypothetical protein
MPTYTITNFSSTEFQLTIDGTALLYKKVYASTYVNGDYLLLFCQQVETNSFRQQYRIHYTDCTNPSAASAVALKDAVDFIIESYANYAEQVLLEVKNTSGSPITKGTPVYITGTVGATQVLEVAPADASNSAKMPATGLVYSTIANNGFGHVIVTGLLTNITTSPIDGVTPTVNQTIYVKPGGGLTLTKPTGTNLIQNVGKVGKVSVGGAGSIAVANIQRTNDIPNIAQNNFWIGNASGVPTAAPLSGDVTNSAGAVTIANSAVTLGKMANLAANSIIGNNTGSPATPIALTTAQTTAMLNLFTSTLQGLAPASGGGTTNFLRADGTWAAPAGGGGLSGSGTANEIAYFTAPTTLASLTTATYPSLTELSYVKGVTSAIQTQLNGKLSAAITSLNGLTGATQTFATGTTGTDFGIVSSGTAHTFNIPSASTTARGLVTTGTQTLSGLKTFDSRLTVSAGGLSVTSTTNSNSVVATSGNTSIEATPGSSTSNVLIVKNNNSTTLNASFCIGLDTVNTSTVADIRLGSTNPLGIRMYASNDQLAAAPIGAAFQMFRNSHPSFSGQLYFDSGSNNSAAIIYRTALTGANATERLRIFSDGNIGINVSGTNAGFKLDVNGTTRLQNDVTISDTRNFILATGTGTKIGTATNQKLSFWNAAPIVQPTTGVAAAARVGGGGTNVTDTDTFDGYTIAQVIKALRNTGLLA